MTTSVPPSGSFWGAGRAGMSPLPRASLSFLLMTSHLKSYADFTIGYNVVPSTYFALPPRSKQTGRETHRPQESQHASRAPDRAESPLRTIPCVPPFSYCLTAARPCEVLARPSPLVFSLLRVLSLRLVDVLSYDVRRRYPTT